MCRLARPSHLIRLDLSCNRLESVSGVEAFKHLRMLYLHGNELEAVDDVAAVFGCGELESLTLHGNPVSLTLDLRAYVLRKLPQLKQLDFTAVTATEREQAAQADLRRFGAKRENIILQKLKTPGQLREQRERLRREAEALKAQGEQKRKLDEERKIRDMQLQRQQPHGSK